jgi:hypothetical protein
LALIHSHLESLKLPSILDENESVPTGFTDYCRDLILYAHSIDDIKDDDIDKIKKEDYVNFLF